MCCTMEVFKFSLFGFIAFNLDMVSELITTVTTV
jgi:hypothetical protein